MKPKIKSYYLNTLKPKSKQISWFNILPALSISFSLGQLSHKGTTYNCKETIISFEFLHMCFTVEIRYSFTKSIQSRHQQKNKPFTDLKAGQKVKYGQATLWITSIDHHTGFARARTTESAYNPECGYIFVQVEKLQPIKE